jgi:hypothetical protein
VTRGDYQIVLGDEHKIVEATDWSIMIHPDSKVAMSMILRRRGDTMAKCPRCGVAPENEEVSGWANWSVMSRFDGVITDKGYSSLCPERFRTTVREDNAEEIVSPALNALMTWILAKNRYQSVAPLPQGRTHRRWYGSGSVFFP